MRSLSSHTHVHRQMGQTLLVVGFYIHVLVDPTGVSIWTREVPGSRKIIASPTACLPSSDRSQDGGPSVVVQDNKVHILAALMVANRRTSSPIASD